MEITEKRKQFAAEYAGLFAFLYRYCRYRIPNVHDAEDMVSDIVIRAYEKLEDYDAARGSFRQWLSGIARNTVLMYWRSRKPIVALEDAAVIPDEKAHRGFLRAIEDRFMMQKILARESRETKALLALHYEDGLTYEEIAEMIGKEPAAVRKFFSRLHATLRIKHEVTADVK